MDYKEAIDYICDKLGTTYEVLMPEAILYYRGKLLGQFLVFLACFLMFLFIIKATYERGFDEEDPLCYTVSICAAIGAITSFILFINGLYSLCCYFSSPTIYVIEQLLGG